MTTLYRRHDVTTIAEVNALALSDNQENGALVLGPYSEACSWILPYAIRNEPATTGYWSYQDGYGGDQLRDGDDVTVLVPIEAEEEFQRTYALAASTFPGLSWPEQHDAWRRRLVTPWEAV